MTDPERETPNVFRDAMTDDPKLEASIVLMLTSIFPALNHAMDYGKEFKLDQLTPWTNGAIFGAVSSYIMMAKNDEAELDEVTNVYGCVSDVLNTTGERYSCLDLDRYAQDLLVRIGANAKETYRPTT